MMMSYKYTIGNIDANKLITDEISTTLSSILMKYLKP